MAEEVSHLDLNGMAHEGGAEGRPLNVPLAMHSNNPPTAPAPTLPPPPLDAGGAAVSTATAIATTFRSELNLVLIAPALLPTGEEVAASSSGGGSGAFSELTPPPNLPEPMHLLPATLPYLDYKSNTAVITTPQAALANRSAVTAAAAGVGALPVVAGVTSVASKPISSSAAVRKKLFGRTKNKDPVINESEKVVAVLPLKLTIPPPATSAVGQGDVDDKLNEQQQKQQQQQSQPQMTSSASSSAVLVSKVSPR